MLSHFSGPSQTLRRLSIVLILILLCLPVVHAQTSGTITGTVIDSTGAVVPNAKVILKNEASNDIRNTVTTDVGYFTFASVAAGTFTVRVEAASFNPWEQRGIALSPGDKINIAPKLAVGGGKEAVTVEAVTDQVQVADSGERSALLSYKDINNLALVSRNVSELLKVLPGVTTVANGLSSSPGFDFKNAGASGSAVGVGLSTNGAPYRGGTAYNLDGVNIIDAGCNCWGNAVVNPDMTQEVKVQSSNFGADTAKGPVVINAISRSGGSRIHGLGYLYTRNGVLNANDWQNNKNGSNRPEDKFYYPGGSVGGPIKIPGTGFNKSNKLFFWAGYEYFWQNLGGANPLTSFIPTPDMLAGNFGPTAANLALCGSMSATSSNACNNLQGTILPDGTLMSGSQIPASFIDPNMLVLTKLWPAANAEPANNGGKNFFLPTSSQHNGYQWRARVDYSINDNNKLFVSYQYATDSSEVPAHIWWTPGNSVPFPGGLGSPTKSKVATANFVHIFSPTLTNEFVAAWGWLDNPFSASDVAKVSRSANHYGYNTVFQTVSDMLPSINANGDLSFPDLSQPDLFSQAFDTRKASPAFGDNLTKVYRSHTIKLGFYTENTGNSQGTYGYTNGNLYFDSYPVENNTAEDFQIGSKNPVANLLMGITYHGNNNGGYSENSSNPITNMAYRTVSTYLQDSWKVRRNLTIDIGARFDHVGRWYDKSDASIGMAVWLPGRYADDLASGKALPGVSWHGIEPGLPVAGAPVRAFFTSPRLGMAWDIFGTGNTIVRGGWGAYRWNDQYNDYAGALQLAQGAKTYNSPAGQTMLVSDISNLAGTISGGGGTSVYAANATDQEVPVTYAFNFTISQKAPWKSLIEVAYVGNKSEKLLMGGQSGSSGIGGADFIDQNKVPLGALFHAAPDGTPVLANLESGNTAPWQPYSAAYGTGYVRVPTHVGYSNYNAIQISWLKRTGRLTYNLNYAWSKALGIVNSTVDAFTVHGNYGVLNIDRPHVINTSYAFDLGKLYHGDAKVLGGITNGWTISGITTWQAGGNLQALYQQNLGLAISGLSTKTYYGTNVGQILPIYTCNPAAGLKADQQINISCLAPPAIGEQGVRQLPYVSSAAYFNSDLAVYKSFRVTEGQKVEFRFSAFNWLNHPLKQFTGNDQIQLRYNADLSPASDIGKGLLNTKTGRRVLELGLKYSF